MDFAAKCQRNKQNRISARTATICQHKELRPDIHLWTYHVTVPVDCRMVKSHSTTPVTLRAHSSLQCSTERWGKQCCFSCNKQRSESDFFSEKSRQILPKVSIVWEYFKENKAAKHSNSAKLSKLSMVVLLDARPACQQPGSWKIHFKKIYLSTTKIIFALQPNCS